MDSTLCCYSLNSMTDEYEKLLRRTRPPRVEIDNEASKTATVIRVDSATKHGVLLEVVQVLADLNLIITKAYISSDGECTNVDMLDYIEKSLGPKSCFYYNVSCPIGVNATANHTSIELIGCDRPGLLSEVSAVLTSLKCNIVDAEVWTHNGRAAAVVNVTDEETGLAISDKERVDTVKELLRHVLKGSNQRRTVVTQGVTHTARRLHQMMFYDRDYEYPVSEDVNKKNKPDVTVVNWYVRNYSVVTIRCKDRPKLLFDIVFTLTDMDYVIFHANVDAEGPKAFHEYYIRHIDGSLVSSEAERQRVVQCLDAAIERRVSEGLKFELCTTDRVGLLSDVTRIFRENSLNISRAEVTTRAGKAVNIFYVCGSSGSSIAAKTIDNIRQQIGQTVLKVKGSIDDHKPASESPKSFLFGSLFKSRPFCNFGFVRSSS